MWRPDDRVLDPLTFVRKGFDGRTILADRQDLTLWLSGSMELVPRFWDSIVGNGDEGRLASVSLRRLLVLELGQMDRSRSIMGLRRNRTRTSFWSDSNNRSLRRNRRKDWSIEPFVLKKCVHSPLLSDLFRMSDKMGCMNGQSFGLDEFLSRGRDVTIPASGRWSKSDQHRGHEFEQFEDIVFHRIIGSVFQIGSSEVTDHRSFGLSVRPVL